MPVLTLDFETYSEAGYAPKEGGGWQRLKGASKYGLPVVGMTRYLQDPSAEVLSVSWAVGDDDPSLWVPGMPEPRALFAALSYPGTEIEAWNVAFEVGVWRYLCVPKLRWPALPIYRVRDAMARARAYSLPGALGNAGEVLGLDVQKDKRGGQLLDFFSTPRQPTKADASRRNYPSRYPEKAAELYEYNRQDVRAERAIMERVPELSPAELEWWQVEQAINRRGVHVDMPLVRAAVAIHEEVQAEACQRLQQITWGAVESPTEVAKLLAWMAGRGVHSANLDEEAVDSLLARTDLPADVREVLELRSGAASASVRKYATVERQVCAGDRLHDLFVYHGARTGRETGADVQPQNLPNSGPEVCVCGQCGRRSGAHRVICPWCGNPTLGLDREEWGAEAARDAIATVKTGSLAQLREVWGSPMPVLAGCLRGMFKATPGHVMVGSDYNAIEAVGAAMLTGEQWRIEVFRTHGKIYEMSASKTFGVPLQEILDYKVQNGRHHPLRKKGKVGELAGGYGGGKGAWRNFGAEGTDDELQSQVYAWRDASPQFPLTWYALHDAWVAALNQPAFPIEPTKSTGDRVPGVALAYLRDRDVMQMRLPSGRLLTYHRPRMEPGTFGRPDLSFEGWNTNPKMGPIGWVRLRTFGGRLFENLVQAACRDILTHAAVNVWHAGFKIVTHVHDELVAEVPEALADTHSVAALESIMMTMPAWAAHWPVKAAGGWMAERYQK